MKKILLTTSLFAALAVMFTSCLKDKGFENGTYGINDPDTQPPGVGFPEAVNAINSFSVNSLATPQTINAPLVNLESGKAAASDVHVVLQLDNTIVSAYNTATGSALVVPTASQFSINSLTVTIPAGQRFVSVPIVIPNAASLNLSTTYALGFKIVSADGGYIVAGNLSKVLVSISVKNAYDGIYSVVSGFIQRYTGPGAPICCDGLTGPLGAQNPDLELSTAGANRVKVGNSTSLIGYTWSPGSGVGGIDAMYLDVDPATNNTTSFATGANTTVGNFGGFPNAFVPPGTGPFGPPAANKYDPATRTFHVAFRWNPTAAVREYDVVFKYKGPR